MTMRQRLDLNLPKRDWRKGWMGDVNAPSHEEMPDVTIGFHNDQPAQTADQEDEEVTVARAERAKAEQDPEIQALARRLGVSMNFLLDFRERSISRFGSRLDRIEGES
jgi:hypothetical protein